MTLCRYEMREIFISIQTRALWCMWSSFQWRKDARFGLEERSGVERWNATTRAQKIRHMDPRLTWRWCWCRLCTRSRLNTGSGRWSCWFWWASILGSSCGSGTWPTEPVLSASLPKQNEKTKQQFTSRKSTFIRVVFVNVALKDKQANLLTFVFIWFHLGKTHSVAIFALPPGSYFSHRWPSSIYSKEGRQIS